MKNIISISLILTALILTGCATGEATRTSTTQYAATSPESVQILLEKPSRKYEVIGYVSGKGAHLASQDAVFNSMKEEAAKIGADAIYIQDVHEEAITAQGHMGKFGKALAIKWVK
jgi:hypothetical protein